MATPHYAEEVEQEDIKEPDVNDVLLDLAKERPKVRNFVAGMMLAGRLSFVSDTQSYESYTQSEETQIKPGTIVTRYAVQLGMEPLPPKMEERMLFDRRSFSEDEKKQYTLLHEIAHVIIQEGQRSHDPVIEQLLSVCKVAYEYDGKHFTGVAAHIERANNTKAPFAKRLRRALSRDTSYLLPDDTEEIPTYEEDAVELLAMGLWGRDYFERAVGLLADEDYIQTRKALGLHTLTERNVQMISELVEQVIAGIPTPVRKKS